MPQWIDFYEEHASDRFEIIAFHDASVQSLEEMDRGLDRGIRKMLWKGRDLPFPILLDSTGATLRQFGVRAFPTTLLIDPEGRLVGPVDSRRPEAAWAVLAEGRDPADVHFLEALQAEAATHEARAEDALLHDASIPWSTARETILRNPRYDGLDLPPQEGLVAIGSDPRSKLSEFALLGTGHIPRRHPETLQLQLEGGDAMVLVLVPGGTFSMGEDPGLPGFDAAAEDNESGVHDVELEPFFLSKYELTQCQWTRLTGENPSRYAIGDERCGRAVTCRNPVETVNWNEARDVLHGLGLQLPTEAQWEYAARAGTTSVWWTGDTLQRMDKAANLADAFLHRNNGDPKWTYELRLNDGQGVHAPVGTYQPNPFGLHDTIGNVWEWCSDSFHEYAAAARREGDGASTLPPSLSRIGRGGCWRSPPDWARSSRRFHRTPEYAKGNLGIRPARTVELDDE